MAWPGVPSRPETEENSTNADRSRPAVSSCSRSAAWTLGRMTRSSCCLVSELVPRPSLTERAWEIAATINRNAPLAVRGTRLAIRKGLTLPVYEAEVLAESHRLRVAATEDAKEGPAAFTEKRPAVFKGK